MAQSGSMSFTYENSPRLYKQFANQVKKFKKARRKAVEGMGYVFGEEAKKITQDENHVDTSLYVNSINHITNIPHTNKSGKGKRIATEKDVIHELHEDEDETTLLSGSAVHYASTIEKKWSIMARALDRAEPHMKSVAFMHFHRVHQLDTKRND